MRATANHSAQSPQAPREEVFRRLLALQMQRGEATPPDHPTRAAYFLLDHDPGQIDAERFVTVVLERLLRRISRQSFQRTVEGGEGLRGRTDWTATLKARYASGGDPRLLLCRESFRAYNTPENQLVKYLVHHIAAYLQVVPPELRLGHCLLVAGGTTTWLRSNDRLQRIEATLARLGGHVTLRSVTLPEVVTEHHKLRAAAARSKDYGLALALYRKLMVVVNTKEMAGMVALGRRVLPLPLDGGSASEPYLRLAAALLRH